MLDKTEAKTKPFRLEEATIDDLHPAIRSGARLLSRWCSIVSPASAPTTASPALW